MGVGALQADGQQRCEGRRAQRGQGKHSALSGRPDEGCKEARAKAEDKPREEQEARHNQQAGERGNRDGRIFPSLFAAAARAANGKDQAAAHRMPIFRRHAPTQEMGTHGKPGRQRNDHARRSPRRGFQRADDAFGIHKRCGGDLYAFVEQEFNRLRRVLQEVAIAGGAFEERGMGQGAGAGKRAEQKGQEGAKRGAFHFGGDDLLACVAATGKPGRTDRKSPA